MSPKIDVAHKGIFMSNRKSSTMYRRIQGSHSPLSPLPPQPKTHLSNTISTGRGSYFTPTHGGNRALTVNSSFRRSFTPRISEITPPAVSPIDQNALHDPINQTFVIPRTPLTKQNEPPQLPTIICTDHDASDSDDSIYFTPPSEAAIVNKIRSANSSAPK